MVDPPPRPPPPSASLLAGLREADAAFGAVPVAADVDARVLARARGAGAPGLTKGFRLALGMGALAGAAAIAVALAMPRAVESEPAPVVRAGGPAERAAPDGGPTPAADDDARAVSPSVERAERAAPLPGSTTRGARSRRAPKQETDAPFDLTAEIRIAEDLALHGRAADADARLGALLGKTTDLRARTALSAERVILRAQAAGTGPGADATVCAALGEHRRIAGALDDDLAALANQHGCAR